MFLFIFERERRRGRERERTLAGEGQRGRERISGRLHTVGTEPDAGLEPTNHEFMA